MTIKWTKLVRKDHVAYRTKDRRYLLSPIIAPIGKGFPKFILYRLKDGKAHQDCGSFFDIKYAEEAIERWDAR